MAIKYPYIIIIGVILFVVIFLYSKKYDFNIIKKNNKKIANTSVIKNTSAYKKFFKKYRLCLYLLYVLIFIGFISSSLMTSRIIKEQTRNDEIYNRDIILCMDISSSVDDLNMELITTYKDLLSKLNGERFGISIFNTSSVMLVPLTDDYDYISEVLDTLYLAINGDYYNDNYDLYDRLYLIEYISSGTLIGNQSRGSSLAGDGLASCVLDFDNTEKDRSKIIVFSTDNDVIGQEYVDVKDAAKMGKNRDVTVYTIAPSFAKKEDIEGLKYAANITGGNFYSHERKSTVDGIVQEIEKKEKSKLVMPDKVVVSDHPNIPFILMIISFAVIVIIDKVVLA